MIYCVVVAVESDNPALAADLVDRRLGPKQLHAVVKVLDDAGNVVWKAPGYARRRPR